MVEYVDLYDNYRNKVDKKIMRSDAVPKGLYRLIIHVCLFNSNNQMLIQKRSALKNSRPNLWDVSVSGAVSSGENSQVSASRELKEELSIEYSLENVYPNLSLKSEIRIDDIFLINNFDIDISKLNLQKEEVVEVRWASQDEIIKMIKDRTFIPFNSDYIKLLFHLKDKNNIFDI